MKILKGNGGRNGEDPNLEVDQSFSPTHPVTKSDIHASQSQQFCGGTELSSTLKIQRSRLDINGNAWSPVLAFVW